MRLLPIALVVVSFAVTAGCTVTASGVPSPSTRTSDSSVPTSKEPDRHGAPDVPVPLDPTRFLTDPCATLTQVQLAGFGITQPGVPDTEGAIAEFAGPSCDWTAPPEVNSVISVSFVTADENGLADVYAAQERDGYFVETIVNGYPAVFREPYGDGRDLGRCGISVGVTNSLYFSALEQGVLDPQGACERAKQVAAAVITTMQGG